MNYHHHITIDGYVLPDDEFTSRFFVRAACGADKVKEVFGSVQQVSFEGAPQGETAFVTELTDKASLKKSLADRGEIRSVIRVTDY